MAHIHDQVGALISNQEAGYLLRCFHGNERKRESTGHLQS